MAPKDLYATLGVSKTATPDEIKKAYRKLAKKLHPDVNPGNKKSEERFKDVNTAFETLGDPKRRALYDEFGDDALRTGFDEEKAKTYRAYRAQAAAAGAGGGGFNVNPEIFSRAGGFDPSDLGSMFGDLFSRRQQARAPPGPAPGEESEAELQIDLRDAVLGAEREISLQRQIRCGECKGAGHKPGAKSVECPQCSGSGQVEMGGLFRGPCPGCQGRGRVQEPCPRCKGRGTVAQTAHLKIKVPAGVETGSKVRLRGEGGAGQRGGPAGDLYLRIVVRPHPIVSVSGRDLSMALSVTVPEALSGAEVTAPTFEGPVKLKIPPGSQSGRRLRLRGRGLPPLGKSDAEARGDFYVVLQIVLPPPSDEARAAAAKMAPLYPGDVRKDVTL